MYLIAVPDNSRVQPGRPHYAELPPSPALAPWIECWWTLHAAGPSPVPNRVLPDGCTDIILGLGDEPGPVAIGTMRSAAVYPLSAPVDYFGVRFRPGCGLPFLGVPLSELTDARVRLDDLWGREAARLVDVPTDARLARMERVLSERLHRWLRDRRNDEPLAYRAVALMRQSRGGASIRDVASALGVGERRLERAFDRGVGVAPKVFARVLRLRRAVRRIEAATGAGTPLVWTALAFDAGYADQAHLIREFRALAGVTPLEYATEHEGVGFVQYDSAARA
jgi:AraC-like DNA-binding protein